MLFPNPRSNLALAVTTVFVVSFVERWSHCQLLSLPEALPFLRSSTTMKNNGGILLSVLQELNVSHNRLNLLPTDLFRLPCLQTLDASHNSISIVPLQMWFAPALQQLNLSHNNLQSLPTTAGLLSKSMARGTAGPAAAHSMSRSITMSALARSYSERGPPVDNDSYAGNVGGDDTVAEDAEHAFRRHMLRHSCYWMGNVSIAQVLSNAGGNNNNNNGLDFTPAAAAAATGRHQPPSNSNNNSGSTTRNSGAAVATAAAAWSSQLQVLDVSNNQLSEVPAQLACFCPVLTTLKMSYNKIEDAGLTSIYSFAIKHLFLDHNLLTSIPSDLLAVAAESTTTTTNSVQQHQQSHSSRQPRDLQRRMRGSNAARVPEHEHDSNNGLFSTSVINVPNASLMKRSNSSYSYAAVASSLTEPSPLAGGGGVAVPLRIASGGGANNFPESPMYAGGAAADYSQFECGRGSSTLRHISPRVRLSTSSDTVAGFVGCPHRQHWRLENLRTLDVSFNRLKQLVFTRNADHAQSAKEQSWTSDHHATKAAANGAAAGAARARDPSAQRGAAASRGATDRNLSRADLTLFPALTTLDASDNQLSVVPPEIADMPSLSTLNFANNVQLAELPPELGLLHRLWNVNARGCQLNEPLRSMLNQPKVFRASDVLMYLRSVLEHSRPYRRVKLMVLGDAGVGKSMLLRAMQGVAAASAPTNIIPSSSSAAPDTNHKSRNSRFSAAGRAGGRSRSSAVGHYVKDGDSKNSSRIRSSSRPRIKSAFSSSTDSTNSPANAASIDLSEFTYCSDAVLPINNNENSSFITETDYENVAVTFRTWDFADATEDCCYFATHQYFLTRRAIYLCVWNMLDGERGITKLARWLTAIQTRCAGAPVVIVGTHVDVLSQKCRQQSISVSAHVARLRARITELYMDVDPEKMGLPRVLAQVEVTSLPSAAAAAGGNRRSKSETNDGGGFVKRLLQILYDVACKERAPSGGSGGNLLLLDEKVPKLYLDFEQLVYQLRYEMSESGQHPVLTWEQYEAIVRHELHARFQSNIRDERELRHLSRFMHENGVIIHYESSGLLSTLYFLDPQWLYELLTRVVRRENLVAARSTTTNVGLMKSDELRQLFQSTKYASVDVNLYISELLNKFELALTLDASFMLIPTHLPPLDSPMMTLVPMRPITPQALQLFFNNINKQRSAQRAPLQIFSVKHDDTQTVRRLYITRHFPCGFWPRLMSRIMSDERYQSRIADVFLLGVSSSAIVDNAATLRRVWRTYLNPHWACWQHGLELVVFESVVILRLRLFTRFDDQQQQQAVDADVAPVTEDAAPSENKSVIVVRNSKPPTNYPTKAAVIEQHKAASNKIAAAAPVVSKTTTIKQQQKSRARFRGTLTLPTDTALSISTFEPDDNARGDIGTVSKQQILMLSKFSAIELTMPHVSLLPCSTTPTALKNLFTESSGGDDAAAATTGKADINTRVTTFLLNITVHHMDSLLEDWYPSVGTRFLHTSYGDYVLQRVCICPHCYVEPVVETADELSPPLSVGKAISPRSVTSNDSFELIDNVPATAVPTSPLSRNIKRVTMQSFLVEECICCMLRAKPLACPVHGELNMETLAPDIIFADIPSQLHIKPTDVKRGRILGSGSFGFVYKAVVLEKNGTMRSDVAVKTLVPCEPGFGADARLVSAYKAALNQWQREPLQTSTQAYLSARQELNILTVLQYRYIVALRGICLKPFSLVLELAPQGSLLTQLQKLHSGAAGEQQQQFIRAKPFQRVCVQIAQALEFLHLRHIIFRDLKSDNVLVWELSDEQVLVKLADYGISRIVSVTNTTKGFAGTEAYIAPEIIRHGGEEEYNEKADCYSFAMLMYELITLRQPLPGQEALKEFILDGGRPPLTTAHLHYPSPVYDLMVLAWSQAARERPSSSQLVSITRTPEFSHLQDVVAFEEAKRDMGSAGVFAFSNLAADVAALDGDDSWLLGNRSITNGNGGGVPGVIWLLSQKGVCDVAEIDHEGFQLHKSRADCLPSRISLAEKVEHDGTVWIAPASSMLVIDIHSALTAEKIDTVVLPDINIVRKLVLNEEFCREVLLVDEDTTPGNARRADLLCTSFVRRGESVNSQESREKNYAAK